jgi:hypothetical protein
MDMEQEKRAASVAGLVMESNSIDFIILRNKML